jgi:regulation of enolase protein 1 (concanavalin A-like superfamily)
MKGNDGHAWVRIDRKGDELIGLTSDEGKQWTEFGRCKIALPKDAFIGLAVCSHDGGRLNKAMFEQVKRD